MYPQAASSLMGQKSLKRCPQWDANQILEASGLDLSELNVAHQGRLPGGSGLGAHTVWGGRVTEE